MLTGSFIGLSELSCQYLHESIPGRAIITMGTAKAIGLLGPHSSYLSLGKKERERRNAYTALLEAQISEEQLQEIRAATNGNFVLGNERFQREIHRALDRRVTPGAPGRPCVER